MNCPHKNGVHLIGLTPDPNASIIVTGLRPGLPILPQRMANLPIDSRGFPVPWFVEWIDGKPDFRVMSGEKFIRAIKFNLCWCCGQPMGAYKVFVAGPMCGINRTSAEPPSHRECAEFAAKACPFLTIPKMTRNDRNLPAHEKPAGEMIARNPGVTMLWTTKAYKPFEADGGILIEMGLPESVE